MDPIEVLSVGDVATDVFIPLEDPHVEVREEHGRRLLVLPFGGKVPVEQARRVTAGGNAANAAVAFARFGLSVGLVSHVGADAAGSELLAALRAAGVDTSLVRVDEGRVTNRNYVLWHGDDRTILVHHERYDYRWPRLAGVATTGWVYLSSVGAGSGHYYAQLAAWLDRHRSVRLAFQPGSNQVALGAQRLAVLYEHSEVVVCNREEAALIGGRAAGDMPGLLEGLHVLGARIAVVTDGPAGAWASDGSRRLWAPCLPDDQPPVDRTGAGDAFAATLVAAMARGCGLDEALAMAPVNARSVVHQLGTQAGLLDEKSIRAVLERCPGELAVRPA